MKVRSPMRYLKKARSWHYSAALVPALLFLASTLQAEESYDLFDPRSAPPLNPTQTTVRGTVSRVEGKDFHLKAGDEIIRVSVDELADNPLNGEGRPQIEEGDRVEVVGKISTGLVEGRLLEAHSIVELQDD